MITFRDWSRRLFVLTFGIALCLATTTFPARANLLQDGGCLVTVTLTFGSFVRLDSGLSASAGMGGGGSTCVAAADTGNLPLSLLTSVGFSSTSGYGSIVTTCEALTVDGRYTINFGGALGSGSGDWHFDGSLAGGELDMIGTLNGSDMLVASIVLVLDPLNPWNPSRAQACAAVNSGGTKTITYTGWMTFLDP
jgi:hypothetical protein